MPSATPRPSDVEPLGPGVYKRAAGPAFASVAPTPTDLLRALRAVGRHLEPTAMELSHELSASTGRRVYLKLENCSPIRSFKARGAVAALARMSSAELEAGIVTASTGNHGQGVAFAAARFGTRCTVVVPSQTAPVKARQIAHLGAELVTSGASLTDAQLAALEIAERRGMRYIEDGEDPALMAGAATVTWEMLTAEPDLDSILVPVGGGNLIASTLLAAELLRPDLAVVGVQSTASFGATLSWLEGEMRSSECTTFAGGLAAERPGGLALGVMIRLLRRMALVNEDDLLATIRTFYEATGFVVEGAATAPLAALLLYPDEIPGERVGLVVSGAWLSTVDLRRSLDLERPDRVR